MTMQWRYTGYIKCNHAGHITYYQQGNTGGDELPADYIMHRYYVRHNKTGNVYQREIYLDCASYLSTMLADWNDGQDIWTYQITPPTQEVTQ